MLADKSKFDVGTCDPAPFPSLAVCGEVQPACAQSWVGALGASGSVSHSDSPSMGGLGGEHSGLC